MTKQHLDGDVQKAARYSERETEGRSGLKIDICNLQVHMIPFVFLFVLNYNHLFPFQRISDFLWGVTSSPLNKVS